MKDELQKAMSDNDLLHRLLCFDFSAKTCDKTHSDKLGLDDDTKESYFGLTMREISIIYQKLNPLELFEAMKQFREWIQNKMPHLEVAKSAENDEFDLSMDTEMTPILPFR